MTMTDLPKEQLLQDLRIERRKAEHRIKVLRKIIRDSALEIESIESRLRGHRARRGIPAMKGMCDWCASKAIGEIWWTDERGQHRERRWCREHVDSYHNHIRQGDMSGT